MTARRLLSPTPVLVLLAVLAAVIGSEAIANRPQLSAPTRVATVDLQRVVNEVETKMNWQVQINGLVDRFREEETSRREAVERAFKEAEAIEDPVRRQAKRDEVAFMQLEFEEWGRLQTANILNEKALMWRTIYRAIREEIARLADTSGWDLVLVNDSLGEVGVNPASNQNPEQQVLAQILGRRILHAGEATDISEELIVRLRNR